MKKKWQVICAVLAIMLALGGCGSGSLKSDSTMNQTEAASFGMETGAAYDTTAEVAEEDYAMSGEAAGAAGELEVPNGQKLIKTVNMNVETTEFDKLVEQLKAKTEELGGYVESSEMSSSGDYASRWAYLVLRIPADKLDSFTEQIGENSNVTYSSEMTEDVTLSYVDMESHLAALRTEQETLLAMLEKAEKLEDILSIQSQLTSVRYEIESYESQLRVYDNQVNYSTVYLNVDEVVRETSAAGKTFGESVKTRFSDNVYRIVQGLRNFAIGFLGAIPILILLAVIVAIVLVVIRVIRRIGNRKKEKRKRRDTENDLKQ